MKKILIVLLCLFCSVGLFAQSYFTSSFGLSLLKFNESAYVGGTYVSVDEKSSAMNFDFRFSTFAKDSTVGLNFGINMMCPISASANGVDIPTDFFNSNWCPQIGIAILQKITDNMTMIGGVGYELLYNYSSEYNTTLHARLSVNTFVHGLYATDTFIYSASENMKVNFGASFFFPFSASQTASASGYGSEKLTYQYSGIMFEPYIGISFSK